MGALGCLALLFCLCVAAQAQTPPKSGQNDSPTGRPTVTAVVTETRISGDSGAYHLDWNGTSGTFLRRALGSEPEQSLPLVYLHSEPGPKGYAKYLTWFLARENDRFSLVWCYLNDSGREFYCWLYRYPTNQLTSLRFVGDYRFMPGPEPVAPTVASDFKVTTTPHYSGPDFTYRDWTRRNGQIAQLNLEPTRVDAFASPLEASPGTESANPPPAATAVTPVKTLANLRVYPMHEVHVARGNGWRPGGWRELHALAFDAASDPYYLILYSNVPRGYVIDLKRGQAFVADYGAKVNFANNDAVFGTKEDLVAGPPELRIRRFARTEIPLASTHKYENPYAEVLLDVEFRMPDGKKVSVPGFWDGEGTWRVRMAPTQVGAWYWRSYSSDPEMDKQSGSFVCIADDTGNKGFVRVNPGFTYQHQFLYANGNLFFPAFLRDPVHYLPTEERNPFTPRTPQNDKKSDLTLLLRLEDMPGKPEAAPSLPLALPAQSPAQEMPASFQAFQQRVDSASTRGFNRFIGGYMLDAVQFAAKTQRNEGGAPFLGYDLDRLNPAYFQWMDRRVAYCNEKGIIPDIGVTTFDAPFLSTLPEEQMTRMWRYVLARYSSFDVCWNLFGKPEGTPFPPDADAKVKLFAHLAEQYDPVGHPTSTVVPNSQPAPIKPVGAPRPGGLVITPDEPLPPNATVPQLTPDTQPTLPPRPQPGGKSPADKKTLPPRRGAPAPPGGSEMPQIPPPPKLPGASLPGAPGLPGTLNPLGDPAPAAPGKSRRNRRGGAKTGDEAAGSEQKEASESYLTIPDPQVAETQRNSQLYNRRSRAFVPEPIVRYGRDSWLDFITLAGGDPSALAFDYRLNKPLVLLDGPVAGEPDAARYRLWETRMRGAFWAGSASSTSGAADALDAPVSQWQIACAKFFQKTRFDRLEPHQDMLGGPEESMFDRRRRKRAQAEALKTDPNAAGKGVPSNGAGQPDADTADNENDATSHMADSARAVAPGPIYVLADPAWEYVIYFQRGGSVTLDLLEATGPIQQFWFNPRTGVFLPEDRVQGGAYRTFNTPDTQDWVLYLTRRTTEERHGIREIKSGQDEHQGLY